MSRQLLEDCLFEIFEYLENDKITLHSCLLTNRLWCQTSVCILWRNIWKFKQFENFTENLNHGNAVTINGKKEL